MTKGPGKYDDMATVVQNATSAEAVIVIVVGGNRGHGFSVQGTEETLKAVPSLLDMVARTIREDMG